MEYSYFIMNEAKSTQTINASFDSVTIKLFATAFGVLFKYKDYPTVPVTICEDLYIGSNCPYIFRVEDPENIGYIDEGTINYMRIGIAKR